MQIHSYVSVKKSPNIASHHRSRTQGSSPKTGFLIYMTFSYIKDLMTWHIEFLNYFNIWHHPISLQNSKQQQHSHKCHHGNCCLYYQLKMLVTVCCVVWIKKHSCTGWVQTLRPIPAIKQVSIRTPPPHIHAQDNIYMHKTSQQILYVTCTRHPNISLSTEAKLNMVTH